MCRVTITCKPVITGHEHDEPTKLPDVRRTGSSQHAWGVSVLRQGPELRPRNRFYRQSQRGRPPSTPAELAH